jgi:hypothetical protein
LTAIGCHECNADFVITDVVGNTVYLQCKCPHVIHVWYPGDPDGIKTLFEHSKITDEYEEKKRVRDATRRG